MPLPLAGLALGALQWLRGSAVGRYAVAAVGLALAVLGARAYWKRQGAAETKDYIDRASNEAAAKRRETRDQIDLDVRRVGAADRLRKWARD